MHEQDNRLLYVRVVAVVLFISRQLRISLYVHNPVLHLLLGNIGQSHLHI